jgi:protease YdgD
VIRWLLPIAAAGVVAGTAAPAVVSAVDGCALRESQDCTVWLAQLAPPSGRPTGLLGPRDRRVRIGPEEWPWSAIGRINVVSGPSQRGLCTGTLTGPRQVVTAAHCLFNSRVNDWAKPDSVHFVIGQSGEKFFGHSLADSFVTSPQFKFKMEDRPRYDYIALDQIKNDWAIITLHEAFNVRPVPIKAVQNAEFAEAATGEQVALAGYGVDHQYVLSVHKGCAAKIDWPDAGSISHMCDSAPGESGGPILLLRDGDAALIGIHSANAQRFQSQVGYQAVAGHGASASGFEMAAGASQR